MNNEDLVRDIGRKGNITARHMVEPSNEHADGEHIVNASLGKYKPCPYDKVGPYSPKKDPSRRATSSVMLRKVEVASRSNSRDKFKKIMNSPCQNHDFQVAYLAKDYTAYKKWLVEEEKKKAKEDSPNTNKQHREDGYDQDGFLNVKDTMLIFSGAKAYEDR
jgi:hypothetical protein